MSNEITLESPEYEKEDDENEVISAVIASKFKRWIGAGLYVGLTGDPKVNWEKVADGLASTNFNGIAMHIISPWNNVGFYPWPFDSTKHVYDLTQRNEAWYEHTLSGLDMLMSRGISPLIKFFDIYQDAAWDRYGTSKSCKFKPFRHNTFGKVLTGQQLFDSWSAGGGAIKYWWISWETNPQNGWLPINYKPVIPFGKPIWDWVGSVIDGCKALRTKYPDIPILYAYGNECYAQTNGDGTYPHGGKSIGAGPEVQNWFFGMWKAGGFNRVLSPWTVNGFLKNFIECWNIDCMGPGNTPDIKAQAQAMTANGNRILHTMVREVHSVEGPKPENDSDIPLDTWVKGGCSSKRFLFSRDGTGETLPLASQNARAMYKDSDALLLDLKWLMPADADWKMRDMQHNFDAMLPLMKSVVE